MVRSTTTWLATIVAVVLAMTACAGIGKSGEASSGDPTPGPDTAVTTDQPQSPPTSALTRDDHSGVLVVLRSDSSDIPDRPFDHGDVLVVPMAVAAEFWTALGFDAGGPATLNRMAMQIEEPSLPDGVRVMGISASGHFPLPPLDGDVLLCLANAGPTDEAGSPYAVSGCALVPADRLVAGSVTLDVGIAGVTLGH